MGGARRGLKPKGRWIIAATRYKSEIRNSSRILGRFGGFYTASLCQNWWWTDLLLPMTCIVLPHSEPCQWLGAARALPSVGHQTVFGPRCFQGGAVGCPILEPTISSHFVKNVPQSGHELRYDHFDTQLKSKSHSVLDSALQIPFCAFATLTCAICQVVLNKVYQDRSPGNWTEAN